MSVIWPWPWASTDVTLDMSGVIPLPAANIRKSADRSLGVNVPPGGRTSSTVPART